jgi:hypothetical protein
MYVCKFGRKGLSYIHGAIVEKQKTSDTSPKNKIALHTANITPFPYAVYIFKVVKIVFK